MALSDTARTNASGSGAAKNQGDERNNWSRMWMMILTLIWLAVVLAGLILYVFLPRWIVVAPFRHGQLQVVAASVWSALLGSIAINLKGIVDHRVITESAAQRTRSAFPAPFFNTPWDSTWSFWYALRPVNGIVVGLAAWFLILVVSGGKLPSLAAVSVAAFVLAFQERRFFNFINEAAKLVLTVPNELSSTGLAVSGLSPAQGQKGQTVIITGRGMHRGATVYFGSNPLTQAVVSPDGTAIAGVVPAGQGAVDVFVLNPDGTARRLGKGFTYLAPAENPVAPAGT